MSKMAPCLIAEVLELVPGDLVKAHSKRFSIITIGETLVDNQELKCTIPRYFLYLGNTKHNGFLCTVFLYGDKKILVREVHKNYVESIYMKVND